MKPLQIMLALCQHFPGHNIKQILAAFRSPLTTNSYWQNEGHLALAILLPMSTKNCRFSSYLKFPQHAQYSPRNGCQHVNDQTAFPLNHGRF